MSPNQRLGLVVLATAVAVATFLILRPADGQQQRDRTAGTTTGAARPGPGTTTATTETAAEPERPAVKRLVLERGRPVGGVRELRFAAGETARIEVSSDAPDELHLHGYDITRETQPGKPARFVFEAEAEGSFELESHTAGDTGLDPLVASVVVEPS